MLITAGINPNDPRRLFARLVIALILFAICIVLYPIVYCRFTNVC